MAQALGSVVGMSVGGPALATLATVGSERSGAGAARRHTHGDDGGVPYNCGGPQ